MTPIASVYDWLMLVHVLAAMVWLGAVLALSALATLTVRSGDAAAVARALLGPRSFRRSSGT